MGKRPTAEALLSIHQRLLAEDPVAPAELAEMSIEHLAEELRIGNSRLRDESMAYDAATDAILEFAKFPHRYEPSRSGVWSFLKMAARRNLANLQQKENRQRGRISRFKSVALHDPTRKKTEKSILASLAEAEEDGALRKELRAKTVSFSPEEAAVFSLMSDGVRATEEYARVLGIDDRPRDEQKRVVKRVKDRLLKRLKRSLKER